MPRRNLSSVLTMPATLFPPPSPPLASAYRGASSLTNRRSSSWCGV